VRKEHWLVKLLVEDLREALQIQEASVRTPLEDDSVEMTQRLIDDIRVTQDSYVPTARDYALKN
jgi:hypothetical protein